MGVHSVMGKLGGRTQRNGQAWWRTQCNGQAWWRTQCNGQAWWCTQRNGQAWWRTQRNGQGQDHSMTLRSGVANLTIKIMLVTIMNV